MNIFSRKAVFFTSCILLYLLQACSDPISKSSAQPSTAAKSTDNISTIIASEQFFELSMNAAPFLPLDQFSKNIACSVPEENGSTHTTSKQANYKDYAWESRVAHDWSFFNAS
jgi:hypothetical protein